MGTGLIFFGMELMSLATLPLQHYQPFSDLMANMDHPVWGILIGAAFTAMVQSSAATTGIVIVLASQGALTLEAGIALALGANIGTCVTALIASIGKPAEAVRAAVVHVLFNVVGALLWIGLIPQLAAIVQTISPSALARQIANAHTVFNVANTALLIWFVRPIAKLTVWLVPDRLAKGDEPATPKYLDPAYLDTPALALDRVRLEVGRMGGRVIRMLEAAPEAVLRGDQQKLDTIVRMDDDADRLHEAIVDYLRRLARKELSQEATDEAQQLLAVAMYFENVGDIIETNLATLGRERLAQQIDVSEPTQESIDTLYRAVSVAMNTSLLAVRENDTTLAQRTIDMKERIDELANAALDQVAERLLADEPKRVAAFRIETDVIGQLKRLYYLAKRIAKTIHAAETPAGV
jgi:phosphate:Na+ symporter